MMILMLTSSVAVLVACVAFGLGDALTVRYFTVRDLAALAKIVGQNSSSALASGDRDAAARVLSSLRAEPNVMEAALYSKSGEVLAEYYKVHASVLPPPKAPDGTCGNFQA